MQGTLLDAVVADVSSFSYVLSQTWMLWQSDLYFNGNAMD